MSWLWRAETRILGWALAGALATARAGTPDLAKSFPAGPEVYLEVSSTGGFATELDRPGGRLRKLVESEGFQGFHESKLALKLGERFRTWLDALFPELATAAIARQLLGGRGALALYDISDLRFLYVVEASAATGLDALLGKSKVKAEKITEDGVTLTAVKTGSGGFFVRRAGPLVVLANDRELALKAARLTDASSLAQEGSFARLFAKLPEGMVRIYVPARIQASVYMRNYWVGGSDDLPPALAAAASLRRVEGSDEVYEETRVREGDPPAPLAAAPGLDRWLPAWTFREQGSGPVLHGKLATALATVVARPRAGGPEPAWEKLVETLGSELEGVEAFGSAGCLKAFPPAGKEAWGPAPEGHFGAAWPPTDGLYVRPHAVLALRFAAGAPMPQGAVAEALRTYYGELLELAEPPAWSGSPVTGQVLALPLFEDLAPALVVDDRTLVLVAPASALGEVRQGATASDVKETLGVAFQSPAAGTFRQAYVAGPALLAEARMLEQGAHLAEDWYGRNLADFARLHLRKPLEGPFAGLRGMAGQYRGDGGLVLETVQVRF